MSLLSFLSQKDVKAKFREVFSTLSLLPYGEMQAPAYTKNYTLVGTAFDYLLRFHLKYLYPFAQAKPWVAENTLRLPWLQKQRDTFELAQTIVATAHLDYDTYLQTGQVSDALLYSVLCLAQLDPIFRRGVVVPHLGRVDPLDMADLRGLLALVTPQTFSVKEICCLNPTFGVGSALVGGADADLVIDNTLIDVKTTIRSKPERQHLYQLIGYYTLYRLGGLKGTPETHCINQVAIYSSRYGCLQVRAIDDIIDEVRFADFSQWFIKRAEQEFDTNLAQLRAFNHS